jgi:hypothetical protein
MEFMDGQGHGGLADYFRTIVILCDDFIRSAEGIRELSSLNSGASRLARDLLETERYEISHFMALENTLGKYQSHITRLYSRFPEDPLLDSLFRRLGSLRDMCAGCIENFHAMGKDTKP